MNTFITRLYKTKDINLKFQNTYVTNNCVMICQKSLATVQIFVFTNGDCVRIFFTVAFFAVPHIFIICLPVDKDFNMQVPIVLKYRTIYVKPY
jgi:hypothetical protein